MRSLRTIDSANSPTAARSGRDRLARIEFRTNDRLLDPANIVLSPDPQILPSSCSALTRYRRASLDFLSCACPAHETKSVDRLPENLKLLPADPGSSRFTAYASGGGSGRLEDAISPIVAP